MTLHIGVIDDDRKVLYQLEKMAEAEEWRFPQQLTLKSAWMGA